ncbi:MAG: hypothetical protein ABI947_17985 [Chloroflexota bacterium]
MGASASTVRSGIILFQAMLIVIAFGWIAIGWRRIYRNIRYLQLEGYDNIRYLRWLFEQPNEVIYSVISVFPIIFVAIVTFLAIPFSDFFSYTGPNTYSWDYFVSNQLPITVLGLSIFNGLIIFVLLKTRPREHDVKQPFARTQRSMRLLVTAFVIDAIPASLFYFAIVRGPLDLTPTFVALASGILTLSLAPLALLFANIINFPIEEVFRRNYLSWGKR